MIVIAIAFSFDTSGYPRPVLEVTLSFIGRRNPIWFISLLLVMGFTAFVCLRYFAKNVGLRQSQKTIVLNLLCMSIGSAVAYAFSAFMLHIRHRQTYGEDPYMLALPDFFRDMPTMPGEMGFLWVAIIMAAVVFTFIFALNKHKAAIIIFVFLIITLIFGFYNYITQTQALEGQLLVGVPLLTSIYITTLLKYKKNHYEFIDKTNFL